MRSLFIGGCLLVGLCSCERSDHIPSYPSLFLMQTIDGRDEGKPFLRYPLYSVKVPSHWKRVDPVASESIADTTKSLCEFIIEDRVKITVHNFPIENILQKIPPIAQVNRWRTQFVSLDPALTILTPQSHDGFVGFYLECQGLLHGESTMLLGWAMQLAPEHDQRLGDHLSKGEKADYTIKVLGPPEYVYKHQEAIILFANSFELIKELYSNL